mmetsp:Transcript_25602/g.89216  ORF Transcript_25602/g.89216 Transcript_25602/m.89216 type:complete len:366 (-) Transcript_25602:246-1343(-)
MSARGGAGDVAVARPSVARVPAEIARAGLSVFKDDGCTKWLTCIAEAISGLNCIGKLFQVVHSPEEVKGLVEDHRAAVAFFARSIEVTDELADCVAASRAHVLVCMGHVQSVMCELEREIVNRSYVINCLIDVTDRLLLAIALVEPFTSQLRALVDDGLAQVAEAERKCKAANDKARHERKVKKDHMWAWCWTGVGLLLTALIQDPKIARYQELAAEHLALHDALERVSKHISCVSADTEQYLRALRRCHATSTELTDSARDPDMSDGVLRATVERKWAAVTCGAGVESDSEGGEDDAASDDRCLRDATSALGETLKRTPKVMSAAQTRMMEMLLMEWAETAALREAKPELFESRVRRSPAPDRE